MIVDDNMHKGGELGSGRSLKSNSAVATISYGTIACSAHVVLLEYLTCRVLVEYDSY